VGGWEKIEKSQGRVSHKTDMEVFRSFRVRRDGRVREEGDESELRLLGKNVLLAKKLMEGTGKGRKKSARV